jgi:hypothetical protein
MRIAIWQTGDALAALADAVPAAVRRGAPVDHLPGRLARSTSRLIVVAQRTW